MIRRLRIRFIAVTMISLSIVLLVIMTAINIFNYSRVRAYADDILSILHEDGGRFGHFDKPIEEKPSEAPPPAPNEENEHVMRPMPDFMNEETPYETRYFTVKYTQGFSAEVGHIASVSKEEAIELAKAVLSKNDERGYIGKYRFLVSEEMVLFIDCTRQLETAKNFLMASIFVSIGGAMCVFILVFLLSARAVYPIAESYERQKRFITDAGHELKTPLTIISASNELIELTSGESENTAAITKQVARMTAMVKSLSSLASLNEAEHALKKSSLALSMICGEMCDLFYPVLTNGGRRFDVEIQNEIEYLGDEGMIRQLLSLVLENAGKYALTFTSFSAARVGKRIAITITNDAEGVENGTLERCFERFYRSDDARASGIDGSGIGLCVAKEITELHGAEISASGQDGCFTIKIIL